MSSGWDWGINNDDTWKCPGCRVYNEKTRAVCPCCEAENPNWTGPKPAAEGSSEKKAAPVFDFGKPSGSSSGSTFSFGAPKSGGDAAGAAKFSFGAPKGGTGPPKPASGTTFSFGAPAAGAPAPAFTFKTSKSAEAPAVAAAASSKTEEIDLNNVFEGSEEPDTMPTIPDGVELSSLQVHRALSATDVSGDVYVVGSGECDQLGLGDMDEYVAEKLRIVPALKGKAVARVVAGGLHTIVLTTDGQVWSWGCNDDNVLGRSGREDLPAQITFGDSEPSIVMITCGDCHAAALTSEGDVWTWGTYKSAEGRLGYSKDVKSQVLPELVPDLRSRYGRVLSLASGSDHTVAVTARGKVVAWGYGGQGQLGRAVTDMKLRGGRTARTVLTPYAIPLPVARGSKSKRIQVSRVYAGGCSTYFVTDNDDVYSMGLNNYGQLGLGHTDNNVTFPELVEPLCGKQVVKFAVGVHHTFALSAKGLVYAFGRGDSGQLGLPCRYPKIPTGTGARTPLLIAPAAFGGEAVRDVAAAGCFSYAVTVSGAVFSWGYGDMFQLANGKDDQEVNQPMKVSDTEASLKSHSLVQVSPGGQHAVFLLSDRQDLPLKILATGVEGTTAGNKKRKAVGGGAAGKAAKVQKK